MMNEAMGTIATVAAGSLWLLTIAIICWSLKSFFEVRDDERKELEEIRLRMRKERQVRAMRKKLRLIVNNDLTDRR